MEIKKVKDSIRDLTFEIVGRKHISFRKPLRKIGLESLSFVELVVKIENLYEIEFASDEVCRFKNLHAVVVYVKNKVKR